MRRRQVPMHHPEMAHSLFLEVEAGRACGYPIVRLVQASLLDRPAGGTPLSRRYCYFACKIIRLPGVGKPDGLRLNRR